MSTEAIESQYWRIKKKWPKRLLWLALFLAAVYVVALPTICDYTDRARVTELLLLTAEVREKIESVLIQEPNKPITLDAGNLIPASIGAKSKSGETIEVTFREITPSGEIRVFSPQLGAMLVVTPSIADGEVAWSCKGWPKRDMPAMCR